MRRVCVDMHRLQTELGSSADVSTALKHLEAEYQKQDEVICRLWVDSELVDEGAESSLSMRLLSSVNSLEVSVDNPSSLLDQVISSWTVQIPQVCQAIEGISEEIRLNPSPGAFKGFLQVVETMQELAQSLEAVKSLLESTPDFDPEPWSQREQRQWEVLKEAFAAFEKRDFVVLSEIMEYDLISVLDDWKALLDEKIRKSGNNG